MDRDNTVFFSSKLVKVFHSSSIQVVTNTKIVFDWGGGTTWCSTRFRFSPTILEDTCRHFCVFQRLQYYLGLKMPRIAWASPAVFSGYMAMSCNAVRSTWCYSLRCVCSTVKVYASPPVLPLPKVLFIIARVVLFHILFHFWQVCFWLLDNLDYYK